MENVSIDVDMKIILKLEKNILTNNDFLFISYRMNQLDYRPSPVQFCVVFISKKVF